MLSKATARCLGPLQTDRAFKSNPPQSDSNKRLCKYWPIARSDLLLEPTSVLDIRSPSPCSTHSSSLAGSCEGVLGSTENGQVVVSSVFSENASDGGQFPDSTSLVETCDLSVWKTANKNGENTMEDKGGIVDTPSESPANPEIQGYINTTWKREGSTQGVSRFQPGGGNEEGSTGGISGIITGNPVAMFSDSHLSELQGQRKIADTSQKTIDSTNFFQSVQAFPFPSNSSVQGNDLAASVVKIDALNGRGKLNDQKKETMKALSVAERNAALEKQNIQPRQGDFLHTLQCNTSVAVDLGCALRATHDVTLNGERSLPRWEEWLEDLQALPDNESQAGNAEKIPSVGMEDLDSTLLHSPSPGPDQTLMKWLLGECEVPVHAKGTMGGLPQLEEGRSCSGQLDLLEAMDAQFSTGTHEVRPGFPVTVADSSSISMVATQASSIANFTPQTLSLPFPASFPFNFPAIPSTVPVSTMLMTAPPFAPIDVKHLQYQHTQPRFDASLIPFPSHGRAASPTRNRSVHFVSNMHPGFAAGYPTMENQGFPIESKAAKSSMFNSPPRPLNPYEAMPTHSVSQGYPMVQKITDKFTNPDLPFHGNRSLEQTSHVFSCGTSQPKFGHQNRFAGPLDNELLQKSTAQRGMLQNIGGAIIKSTDDPFPHVKQELLLPSQQGQDNPISLQLPQFQMASMCAQRGKMGADSIPFTSLDQLLKAAEAVDLGNMSLAQAILARLNQCLSPQGQPLQRAAFYFKEALAKHVMGKGTPIPTHNDTSPVDVVNKITAFKSFCEFSPLPQFAHFTSNQTILEAVEKEDSIHLIDFDLNFGGQWASFLQEIASRPGGPPKLRITTVASQSMELQLTQDMLYAFAKDLNISLEIRVISDRWLECLTAQMFQINEGEAIVVNFTFTLNNLLAQFSSNLNLTNFLQLVKSFSPKVVTVVNVESPCQGSSFFQHFIDSLQFYAFLFDSLESTIPTMENVLRIESSIFVPRIHNIMTATRHNEKNPQWQNLLRGAGFSPVGVSLVAETQAECLVQNRSFNVVKKEESILLYWHGRALVSASAWSG